MDMPGPEITLYVILAFIVLENAFEMYLTKRQIGVYRKSKDVPAELKHVMPKKTFEKARIYGLDKAVYSVMKTIAMLAILVLELRHGFVAYSWRIAKDLTGKCNLNTDNEIIVSAMFVLLLNTVGVVKDIPFKIYEVFVLEEKHGFNKQTYAFFIKDQLKSFILSQVMSTPISAAIVWVVQWGGDYFFVYLWAFASAIAFVLITIYPVLIAPLFDKYRQLEEGELRASIYELAARLKFPLTQLYVVEGSKRSAHSNAYFYGLFKSKRIVLFDTLLKQDPKKETENAEKTDDAEEADSLVEKESTPKKGGYKKKADDKGCSNEEVVAVLAHELGHWSCNHMPKNMFLVEMHLLLMFFSFNYLFNYSPLYEAIGFTHAEVEQCRPVLIGLLLCMQYVLAPYNALISFMMTVLSRRFEYEADAFARRLGYAEHLKGALIKLHLDNLGFPYYDPLYSSWSHSHPTLLQRMNRIDQETRAEQKAKKTK